MKTLILFTSLSFLTLTGYSQTESFVHVTEEEQKLVDLQAEKPNELSTNYNLANYYYNNAVTLVAAQADGSMPGVDGLDNEILRLFNAALNPALNAYESDKENELVLEMLSGIYFGLDEMDAKEKIDKKLKKLRK